MQEALPALLMTHCPHDTQLQSRPSLWVPASNATCTEEVHDQHSAPEAKECTAGTQAAARSQPKTWLADLNGRKRNW